MIEIPIWVLALLIAMSCPLALFVLSLAAVALINLICIMKDERETKHE